MMIRIVDHQWALWFTCRHFRSIFWRYFQTEVLLDYNQLRIEINHRSYYVLFLILGIDLLKYIHWKSEPWIQCAGKWNWGVFVGTGKLTHCQIIAAVCTTSPLLPSTLIHDNRNKATTVLAWSWNLDYKLYYDRNQFMRSRNSDANTQCSVCILMENGKQKRETLSNQIVLLNFRVLFIFKQIWIIKYLWLEFHAQANWIIIGTTGIRKTLNSSSNGTKSPLRFRRKRSTEMRDL